MLDVLDAERQAFRAHAERGNEETAVATVNWTTAAESASKTQQTERPSPQQHVRSLGPPSGE